MNTPAASTLSCRAMILPALIIVLTSYQGQHSFLFSSLEQGMPGFRAKVNPPPSRGATEGSTVLW